MRSRRIPWLIIGTHIVGMMPLVLLLGEYWRVGLMPDPVGIAMQRTGRYALLFLLLSLIPTILYTALGLPHLIRVRRLLGLYAFFYASLHFLIYIGLDYAFNLPLLAHSLPDAMYVLVGLAAFLLLVPLAITSTDGWVRRLGRRWKQLHRLVYPAAALVIWHYAWVFKELRTGPVAAGMILILLFVLRLPPVRDWLTSRRAKLDARSRPHD